MSGHPFSLFLGGGFSFSEVWHQVSSASLKPVCFLSNLICHLYSFMYHLITPWISCTNIDTMILNKDINVTGSIMITMWAFIVLEKRVHVIHELYII